MEGLIFGGKFAFQNRFGLALQLEVNLLFLLCIILYLRANTGSLYLDGRFNGGLLALPGWGGGGYLEGLIHGILRYVKTLVIIVIKINKKLP